MTNVYISQAKAIASNKLLVGNFYPTPKSFSIRYVRYRLLRPFLKVNYKIFNILYSGRPWTSPGSILFFDKVLTNNMVGLEYGSGRSTIYFAKKLKQLVSIEHNPEWFKKVSNQLKSNRIQNVDYFLAIKEKFSLNPDDIDIYMNEHDEYESKNNFKNYYSKVNEYPDSFFDFVMIDGRARVHCGLNAMTKLKKGGIFVLDNSERQRYNPLHKALDSWPRINTTNGLTNTTIWIKP